METGPDKGIKFWLHGILHSYSQIFYSLSPVLALVIATVTFFDPVLGLHGLSAVVLTNGMAYLLGFNRAAIREGLYGFGALLLGLALGYTYAFNAAFACLFAVALLMQLMTAVLLGSFMGKHRLPVLSFPFLITCWMVSLATSGLTHIHPHELHAYTGNENALGSSSWIFRLAHSLDNNSWPAAVNSYFRTLAGTFFINSVLGGVLIAAGLLYFSRIVFSLSIIGFAAAYFFYRLLGADTNDLTYHLLGSNFIFMAIGLGCFYLVPNVYSYITVVALTPILLVVLLFCGKALAVFHLKALTLPFSLVVTVFLFVLHQRWMHRFLHLVSIQYYSAEKTVYKHVTALQRFRFAHLARVSLPFWGQWRVSQGYNGSITHLGEWGYALDFVVTDEHGQTYREPGISADDFYCYNKPVTAPLDGYVYDIVNNVDDNPINAVNVEQNWGNTIIIHHLNGLFSQISHLKKDSFKVTIGEYVTRGTVLAACGNSGRSPEPHIHFQLQAKPQIGAPTLAYPLACFIEHNAQPELKIFEVPREGSLISNVEVATGLLEAFQLLPGKKLSFTGHRQAARWEVLTDAWNRTYLYCRDTRSYAYFVNDGTMFYFTDFEGDRHSVLFMFYLAAYRLLLAACTEITVQDQVPVVHFYHPLLRWIQDLAAPFYIYTKAAYRSQCKQVDNEHAPTHFVLSSQVSTRYGRFTTRSMQFDITVSNKKITGFSVSSGSHTKTFICTG